MNNLRKSCWQLIIFTLFGIFQFPVLTFAQSNLGKLLVGSSKFLEAPERDLAAKELQDEFRRFDGFIPELRPSEAEWVRSEQAAVDSLSGQPAFISRLGILVDSPEYNQFHLKRTLADLIGLTSHVRSNLGTEKEIRDWAEIGTLMMGSIFEDGYPKFARSGRVKIPKESKLLIGDGKNFSTSVYEMIGKGIMSSVVLGYLDKRT